MTYPLIGNYGIAREDSESERAWAEAFVIRELSSIPSSHRADLSLPEWLIEEGIVAIEGVDTRRITRLVREHGSLRCVVSTTDGDAASLVAKAKGTPATDGRNLAAEVTCKEPYEWREGYDQSYPTELEVARGERLKVVAIDTGMKRNILRSLVHVGFDVTVVPCTATAAEILALEPDGVFLSNGPGDPSAVTSVIEAARELVQVEPVFGICLGHQILSIVFGAKTFKMPFGHHGANHPVRDETTGRSTRPPTTLGRAPSIPATTTRARASRRRSAWCRRRCSPATPTSARCSTRAPIMRAVRVASSATGRSLVPALRTSTRPSPSRGSRSTHTARASAAC